MRSKQSRGEAARGVQAGKQFQLISLGIAATHAPHAKSTVKWATTAAWHEMSSISPTPGAVELQSASAWPASTAAQSVSFCMVCLIPKHGKFKLQPA